MTTMKIQIRQGSASTSEATLRTHHVLIDRPVEKGGTDRGPWEEISSLRRWAAAS
jgi:hypothetical protein